MVRYAFVRTNERRPVGQELPILYLARNPKIMYPYDGWHLVRALLSNWLLLGIGLAFLVFGYFSVTYPG